MSFRVLHVLESWSFNAGSPAISLQGLLNELNRRGVSAEVQCGKDLTATAGGDALHAADVIHLYGNNHSVRKAAALVAKAGKPFLVSPLGGWSDESASGSGLWARIQGLFHHGRSLHRAASVLTLNHCELEDLRSRNVHAKIMHMPYGNSFGDDERYGVKGERFDDDLRSGVDASGRIILMLGPLNPSSGCVAVLRAVAELGPTADGWNVVLAGADPGNFRAKLQAAALRKGATGRVHFADAPDVETQRKLLSRASVVISAASRIQFDPSILSAVAARVPVAATRLTAPDELAEVITVCDPTREGIRRSIASLLTMSDEERTKRAERAFETARRTLDWSKLADSYAALYKETARASVRG